ncbi:AAA family ATPase [Paenibacillus pabuli]|uniref:AAA family ATPase n=1 Tax=Paenibacillus pabuli TaxID=1472 RepID=UPI000780D585|nr:AAA family ATPase [Paenibacillus pabuli]MEC0129173.1 DNA topology modulation protein FlaR [Paenibacillus pabuli]
MIREETKTKLRPNKIHIIGSVGSGKSTLARHLSARLDLPYYELDNMVWHRVPQGQDVRNSPEMRDTLLQKAVQSNQWIIEGVHYQWVARSFEQADLIVYLNTPVWKRNVRILKRFTVQKLGLEQGNYRQTFSMLGRMYKWSYQHDRKEKALIMTFLQPHQHKLCMVRDEAELTRYLEESTS